MTRQERLQRSFYARRARIVARELLGKRLVRCDDGRRISGKIVETEAYCDGEKPDLACHATANEGRPTARTAVMFGPAGVAYVYFTYGMHWMFNVVTGDSGDPNAVLIRALELVEGASIVESRRRRLRREWTNGPAKLTQALAIDKEMNGANLCDPDSVIWIEDGPAVPDSHISIGSRIGLGNTPEPWRSVPWRFWIEGNPHVSR